MPTCDKHLEDVFFSTCYIYKRHEREHEESYVCMPDGPLEYSATGTKCAFCGALEPDSRHTAAHNIEPCEKGARSKKSARTFKRKGMFLKHLKDYHGKVDGALLAQKWQQLNPRKAYACGFCGDLFRDIAEYSLHVDDEHYSRNLTSQDWDPTKVIQAFLVHQPEVNEEWQRISKCFQPSEFYWDTCDVKGRGNLQWRLESGTETAVELVKAVWAKRKSMAECEKKIIGSGRPAEENIHTGSTFDVLKYQDGAMQLSEGLADQGFTGGAADSHLCDYPQLQHSTLGTLGPAYNGHSSVELLAPRRVYHESVPVGTAIYSGPYSTDYDGSYSQGNWQARPLPNAHGGTPLYSPAVSHESNPERAGHDTLMSRAPFPENLPSDFHQNTSLDTAQSCEYSIGLVPDPGAFQASNEVPYGEDLSWSWHEEL